MKSRYHNVDFTLKNKQLQNLCMDFLQQYLILSMIIPFIKQKNGDHLVLSFSIFSLSSLFVSPCYPFFLTKKKPNDCVQNKNFLS